VRGGIRPRRLALVGVLFTLNIVPLFQGCLVTNLLDSVCDEDVEPSGFIVDVSQYDLAVRPVHVKDLVIV
jgi:hypothetical protein